MQGPSSDVASPKASETHTLNHRKLRPVRRPARHEAASSSLINMTEASRAAGDSETHDKPTAAPPLSDASSDQKESTTASEQVHEQAVAGDGADTDGESAATGTHEYD